MPKVKQEHFVKRANQIVDGALRVCKTKPTHEVTLRDVVKECGISQGGMYCYFTSIDEIFVEILNRAYGEFQFIEAASKIFDSDKPLMELITETLALCGKLTDEMNAKYGRTLYEISDIFDADPERVVKVIDRIKVSNDTNAAISKLISIIDQEVVHGAVKLKLPKEQIKLLIGLISQGIVRTTAFPNSTETIKAQTGVSDEHTTAQGMMRIFARVLLELMEITERKC